MAWMNRVLHPVYKISETHIGQDFMVPGVEFEEVDSPFFKKKFVALKDKYKDMKRKNRDRFCSDHRSVVFSSYIVFFQRSLHSLAATSTHSAWLEQFKNCTHS